MLSGRDILGRLSHGLDLDEFDAQWPRRADVTGPEGQGGDQLDQWGGEPDSYAEGLEEDDEQYGIRTTFNDGAVEQDGQTIEPYGPDILGEEIVEFESPVEVFPVYKKALQHFQSKEPQSNVVRVDTPETYQGFVADKAVSEIQRRLNELRAVVEKTSTSPLRKWDDIIGAAEAVKTVQSLKAAETTDQATAALPKVDLDLPDYAKGKVQCWRDGNNIVVSIKFADANGAHRIATMAAKPNVSVDDVQAHMKDMSPMEILGALPGLASKITGDRLLGEVASVALRARRNQDVCGMDGSAPVVRVTGLDEARAPLAALMYLQQAAERGDAQAAAELAIIKSAAKSPSGREIAAPLLAESTRLLAEGRAQKGGR